MTATRSLSRRVVGTLGSVTLVAGLTACSAGATDAAGTDSPTATAAPTATASATPTPTPTTQTPTEWDPDASAAWAAEVFPLTGTDQYVLYKDGQLAAAEESGSSVAADTPPGTYELRLSCQGGAESAITITVTATGAATTRLSAPCDESVQTAPVTLVNTGGDGGGQRRRRPARRLGGRTRHRTAGLVGSALRPGTAHAPVSPSDSAWPSPAAGAAAR